MISSNNNLQIKNLLKLQKNSRARQKDKVFIIEGIRMFTEIPEEMFVKAYTTEKFLNEHIELFKDKNYEIVAENIFKEISETKTPQGVLAIVKQQEYFLEDILNKENPAIMVLENLQDPGNLGTIIRTAEGANISGIIMNKNTVDIYNPKVIRSTMGSIYRVPFVYVNNLEEVLEMMKQKHITIYAGHLKGEVFYNKDYKKACAFLVGNEGNGLSNEISKKADELIKIPMYGKVESLNVSIASTIFMYEVLRTRFTN